MRWIEGGGDYIRQKTALDYFPPFWFYFDWRLLPPEQKIYIFLLQKVMMKFKLNSVPMHALFFFDLSSKNLRDQKKIMKKISLGGSEGTCLFSQIVLSPPKGMFVRLQRNLFWRHLRTYSFIHSFIRSFIHSSIHSN